MIVNYRNNNELLTSSFDLSLNKYCAINCLHSFKPGFVYCIRQGEIKNYSVLALFFLFVLQKGRKAEEKEIFGWAHKFFFGVRQVG